MRQNLSPRLSALRKNTLHKTLTRCKIQGISQPEALWDFLIPPFLFLYLPLQKQAALKEDEQLCSPQMREPGQGLIPLGRDFLMFSKNKYCSLPKDRGVFAARGAGVEKTVRQGRKDEVCRKRERSKGYGYDK